MPRAAKGKNDKATNAAKKPAAAPKQQRNKLYAAPEKIAEGTLITDVGKTQWRIGPSIGIGGFGEIYAASRADSKSYDYVVKCEPKDNGPLFVEMHFYMRSAKTDDIQRFKRQHNLKELGMPHMIGNGSVELNGKRHRFIVMPRYGKDVSHFYVSNGNRLPEGTCYRIALQMLDVYEFLHESGYVHADLKAANILLGAGKAGASQTYLVDFGLVARFDINKEFKPDPKKMHNGTINYTSRDAHMGVATMRSDLEILGYNLLEWQGVQLPWVRDKLLNAPVKVQNAKEQFMKDVSKELKQLFKSAVPAPIAEFMQYVAKMQYNETPDYNKCRKMFSDALKNMKMPLTGALQLSIKKAAAVTTINATTSADSSQDSICASDDDFDGTFNRKKPVKTVRAGVNTKHKTIKRTPPSAAKPVAKRSPAVEKIMPRSPIHATPISIHSSPEVSTGKTRGSRQPRTNSASPGKLKRLSATLQSSKESSASSPRKRKALYCQSDTPTTAKSGTPAISLKNTPRSASRLQRFGKTVINDNLTPNPRAGKTYEFNFELDVSLDANVIVNVQRKKRAKVASATSTSGGSSSAKTLSRDVAAATASETSGQRVKLRKLDSSALVQNGDKNSPRTPVVTLKKNMRFRTPRS